MANLHFSGILKGPEELVAAASPQDLTAVWVDLGSELYVAGAQYIGLWVVLDINSSNNARVRLLAKTESAGTDEYLLPIETAGASDIKVEDEYLEFNADADQKVLLSWRLNGLVAYVQFQVQVSAVGGTAGQIDSAYATTSM